MSKHNKDKIIEFVQKMGFSAEAARVYQTMVLRGAMSLSELSRESGVERTRLYRQVPEWVAQGLLQELLAYKSRRYAAVEPTMLANKLSVQKKRIEELELQVPEIEQIASEAMGQQKTRVKYFRGVEGIKQILWNESKARSEVVGYTYRNLIEVVGKEFFEEYARELEKNKVKMRDLRADAFMESVKSEGFVRRHIEHSGWRYLPDSTMKLTHNLDVYDDVVAMYYWDDNDVWGVEIQNARMAKMQRSIFETLWGIAKKVKLESR
ncbi:hypothetical protein KBD69_00660 [Candidatus Woesebacteria bacterium]|nr:hypothetical protein [Candidatus Woesebacteria bacterium]